MVKRLDKMGYLVYEKYRGLQLTSDGISVAKNIHKRHDLLVEFLKMIGIDEDIANRDAEGIEHHLHSQTIEKLEEFIKNTKKETAEAPTHSSLFPPFLLITNQQHIHTYTHKNTYYRNHLPFNRISIF